MSEFEHFIKDRPIMGHIITLIISLFAIYMVYIIEDGNVSKKEFYNEIIKKASVTYVNSLMDTHTSDEQIQMYYYFKQIVEKIDSLDNLKKY